MPGRQAARGHAWNPHRVGGQKSSGSGAGSPNRRSHGFGHGARGPGNRSQACKHGWKIGSVMAGTSATKDRNMAAVKTKRPAPDKRAAAKAKPQPAKDEAPEKETPETPDSPLLDLSDAAVRKMIKSAKKRGYVTYEQLNAVMPSEEVTSEQIEDVLAMLNEMGINVIEQEEHDTSEEGEREEAEEEESEGGELVETQQKLPTKSEAKEPSERTDDPVRMYLREMGSVELL